MDAVRMHAAWRDWRKTGLIMHENPAAHTCLLLFHITFYDPEYQYLLFYRACGSLY
jgi:hypothetical protein